MKPLIRWFIANPVAANLLMCLLIVGGLTSLPMIPQEEFPNIEVDVVEVRVPYLGAAPEEVEASVCIRIEEAIEVVEGISHIKSSAEEGQCQVHAELTTDAKKSKVTNEIKNKVDSINTFPAETEKPTVSEVTITGNALQVVVAGDTDERSLKEAGEQLRDDLLELPGVSRVDLNYARPYEISIEVSELTLRRYGLTLGAIANSVRNSSLDLPGGSIDTGTGEILLRTKSQAYVREDFENIIVLARNDGTVLRLGDIATVIDGFEDSDVLARYNGKPAVVLEVKRVGEEDILKIADAVKKHLVEARKKVPEGIELAVWIDESQDLEDRLDVLMDNAISGLVLVLFVLALFLRLQLALWVALGIPVAVLGTLMVFPAFDLSISTLAVMGFILVLGILVDDAIVVGERVYTHERQGKDPVTAALDGTQEVAVPVLFGVLTTIATFTPLMGITAALGNFFAVIGVVVIISLIFSVIESQFILPSHLAYHSTAAIDTTRFAWGRRWHQWQARLSGTLESLAFNHYRPFLQRALRWRYLTLTIGVAAIVFVVGMLASGRIVMQFFPPVEGTRLFAVLNMPEGTSAQTTHRGLRQLEQAAEALRRELDAGREPGEPSAVRNIVTSVGAPLYKGTVANNASQGPQYGEVAVELNLPRDYSGTPTSTYAARWRELTGPIPGAMELSFTSSAFDAGRAIDIQLRGRDMDALQSAAADLRAALGRYQGVVDITDTFRSGKQEVQLKLLPEARTLGLTAEDLGRQVRRAFYGEEVQRVQRGREDIRIMVRYPQSERQSLGDLENMRIRTAAGDEVAFVSVAEATLGRGYAAISREDGARIVRVVADVERHVTTPEEVLRSLENGFLNNLSQQYPGVSYKMAGEAEQQASATRSLIRNSLLALLVIYGLLAIPLKSYVQPLIIMTSIPFGAMGAILGHYILGVDLVFFSLLGIVALSGVVVNASLMLVVYINRELAKGTDLMSAVSMAGAMRFRAIVLTSLTTFAGLLPLMTTASLAMKFFIGMAVSLGFGVLLATPVTLFLVPCLYLILRDIGDALRPLKTKLALLAAGAGNEAR